MSVYWSRYGAQRLGFYDLLDEIVLMPSRGIPPEVVTEHELTHINIVNNSGLGRLELLISHSKSYARQVLSHEPSDQVIAVASLLQKHDQQVHETIAWYITEQVALNYSPRVEIPGRYDDAVYTLREFVRVKSLDFEQAASTVEAMGIAALSPPFITELWENPGLLSEDWLDHCLVAAQNDPLTRFQTILMWLAEQDVVHINEWATEMWDSRLAEVRSPVPIKKVRSLSRADTQSVFRALVGLAGPTGQLPDTGLAVEPSFYLEAAELLLQFSPQIDRYAQVFVTELSLPKSASDGSHDANARRFSTVTNLVRVGLGPRPGSQAPSVPEGSGYVIATDVERQVATEAVGTVEDLRGWLREYVAFAPIVADSNSYDFGRGDLKGIDVLEGLPHAVFVGASFRRLWCALAGPLNERGLAGSNVLEVQLMGSSQLGEDYGYVLIRPKARISPVVILPTVASKWERMRTFVSDWPGAGNVSLEDARSTIREWLGPLALHVDRAVTAFEKESSWWGLRVRAPDLASRMWTGVVG